jgi:competence protein ComEC
MEWPGRIRPYACAALVLGAAFAAAHGQRWSNAAIRPHTMRFVCTLLDAQTCRTDRGLRFRVNAYQPLPAAPARVVLRGRVEPFDGPRNPGEPDRAAIEHQDGYFAEVAGAQVLQRLPLHDDDPATLLARAHAWALAQLRARLAEPGASILAGELWGERAAFPPGLRAEFQETGTVHILVTAGLHLGVVAMIAMLLLRGCGAPRAACAACTIAIVWSYALFSGAHLPSLRAAVMCSVGLAAYAAGRAPLSWSAYTAALLFFALLFPQDVGSASFLLSFSCVGAILLLGGLVSESLEAFALPERVKEGLVLTIATQIGTWPLTAAVFLLFAPYAVPANLLVVPVVGVTMILGAIQLALTPIPTLAQLAANVNSWPLAWMTGAISTFASLPHAAIPMSPPPPWTIALYDGTVAGAVWCWRRGGRTFALASVLIAIGIVAAPPIAADDRLRITVLDVGQADGIVIQTPAGHTMLVDAGGKLERGTLGGSSAERVGEETVVPFLRRARITHVDVLILSHPHGDHAGGMAPVLRSFPVTEFADGGQRYSGYAYKDAVATARAEGVPIVYPRAGMVWRTDDGLTLTFLGPSLPFIESDNTINDNSIAFILQYKRFRMLFTGDAGVAAEQRFLSEGVDLHADVLKVGHHGSAYSSSPAFIAAVKPRYAIISVGRHNMFGHPAPSTLETLQRFSAHVYRTDEEGAVRIVTDGQTITQSTML